MARAKQPPPYRELRPPYREPPAWEAPPSAGMQNITKFGLSITSAAGLAWFVASLVYGAGGKVATTDATTKELTTRIETLEHTVSEDTHDLKQTINDLRAEHAKQIADDHDSITQMKSQIASEANNIDVLQRNQNNMPIELNMKTEPTAKK